MTPLLDHSENTTSETVAEQRPMSRRALITTAAGAVSGAALASLAPTLLSGQGAKAAPPVVPAAPQVPADPTAVPGMASEPTAARSPFENPSLLPTKVTTGSTLTPLQDLTGTITPSDLFFQRHHNGIALVDPAKYELTIHGLVDKPTTFSLAELKRFPAVTRVHFLECAGNGRVAYKTPKPEMTPQQVDGMMSNGEWTGVPLATVLREVGVKPSAKWFLAEGGDAAKLSRSVPIEKAMEDALLVWGQNGEPLRPANGYPVRLFLPGFEGNTCVKWVRRIELGMSPWMFRDETSKYTDPLADGTARQFSFLIDCKSTITSPAFPLKLTPGWWPVSGLAWSGRGKISRVDVSTDSGKTWTQAELLGQVHTKAHTRFQLMWNWDGKPTRIMSRALDDTGASQPTLAEYKHVRGVATDYHYTYIRGWDVKADGTVVYGVDA